MCAVTAVSSSPITPFHLTLSSLFYLPFFFLNHTYFKGSAYSCHRAVDLRRVWGKLRSCGEPLRWNPVNRSSPFSSHSWDGEEELQINCWNIHCASVTVCACFRGRALVCVILCMIGNCTCNASQCAELRKLVPPLLLLLCHFIIQLNKNSTKMWDKSWIWSQKCILGYKEK